MNDATITAVTGHRRWDSRGRPTVEAVVTTTSGAGRALAPAGASTGSGEALDLRDGGDRFDGLDVTTAVRNIAERIAPTLIGLDAADQATVDAALESLDPSVGFSELGGNAVVAVSLANAHAAAASRGEPLWRTLLGPGVEVAGTVALPVPEIQIFGGGAHAHRRIDIQDLMVVPRGATSFAQALDWTAEIYRAAGRWMDDRGLRMGVADEGGWWPAFDTNQQALDALTAAIEAAGLEPVTQVGIALDIAASQFGRNGRYRLGREERELDTAAMVDLLVSWVDRYPIVSVEDPVAEDDPAGMAAFTAAVGDRIQVVGDDFLVTDADRVARAAGDRSANTVLIKPNQAGTLTRAHAALDAAHARGLQTIVSARSGETEDVSVAHLAVGWGSNGVKVGSITRGERTAKWNEMLRIEESLGDRARGLRR